MYKYCRIKTAVGSVGGFWLVIIKCFWRVGWGSEGGVVRVGWWVGGVGGGGWCGGQLSTGIAWTSILVYQMRWIGLRVTYCNHVANDVTLKQYGQ